MGTPISGAAAYATADDMIVRYDVNTLGQLLSDTGTALTVVQVQTSTKIQALLKAASGWVESASTGGGSYTAADLAALTGNSLEMLKDLVCGFCLWRLWSRRPARLKAMPLPQDVELCLQTLDLIRNGQRVLGIQEVLDAHNPPEPYFMQPGDLRKRNGVSVQARRAFGRRGEWNVPGWW